MTAILGHCELGFRVGQSGARPISDTVAAPENAPADEVLIARVAADDHGAIGELYRRYAVRIYRYSLRIVGDRMRAEDITSETFIAAWRHADRFAGRSTVLTWLFGIARHKALTARNVRSHAPLDEAASVDDPQDDPEASMQKADRSAVVRSCLGRLSAVHREIIDLVYYHEKSVLETAEILAIPPSTVRTRMFYARNKLAALVRKAEQGGLASDDRGETDAA